MRVKVQKAGNLAVFHIDHRMKHDAYVPGMDELGFKQSELSHMMMSIHGVMKFCCEGYEVFVTKGSVFSWEEITPRVISVLSEYLGDSKVENLGEINVLSTQF